MSKIHLSLQEENPSLEVLLQEQNRLQTQGKKLLEATLLGDVLKSAGDVQTGGSFVYGLMIYPDLDIGIVSEDVTRDRAAELISKLFKLEFVRKIATTDKVNFSRETPGKNPLRGYWLGLEVGFEEDVWNLDIWFQKPEWVDNSQDAYANKFKGISDEVKAAILSIKHALIKAGEYDVTFFSDDVYTAVLDKNVRTLEEFYSEIEKSI